MQIHPSFPRLEDHQPSVPVYCVTPDLPGSIHRFYDTSPFSPSGRYLAVTQLPTESRLPQPGETARVLVIDLQEGETHCVAETRAWDTQLGAQVQWGSSDQALFFNDLEVGVWQPYGVRLNPSTGHSERLLGSVYMLQLGGAWAVSPCLRRIARTQPGYGVVIPRASMPANSRAAADDGVYVTNTLSGESHMTISISTMVKALGLRKGSFSNGDFYVFHVKWNPQGTRLMAVLRWLPHRDGGLGWLPWGLGRLQLLERLGRLRRDMIITFKPDGTDIHMAVPPDEWAKGGHHPNWCPDGQRILMNLNVHHDGMRFVLVDYDGRHQRVVCPGKLGSGHPTMHPDNVHILTDAYPDEPVSVGDGTSPIRWLNLNTCEEKLLFRIHAKPPFPGPRRELRVDPHPAWDRSFRYIALNGCPWDGRRRVFLADLSKVTGD